MSPQRKRIMSIIQDGGPADAKSIADILNQSRITTQQLLKRMVRDGQLATLPLAPRTYYATQQQEPTNEDK